MPDPKQEQPKEDAFDADYEREQIRKIGEGLNRLVQHWDYLGNFRGGRNSSDYRDVQRRFRRLFGMRRAGDEPDFLENMEGRSLRNLERSVDATIKSLKKYEERHNSFFGFLGRLFNILNYAKMQDTEIALRRLQEMKNSLVRLRTHNEGLKGPLPAQRVETVSKAPEIRKVEINWKPSKKIRNFADQFEKARAAQAAEQEAAEKKAAEKKAAEKKPAAKTEKAAESNKPEDNKTEESKKPEDNKKTEENKQASENQLNVEVKKKDTVKAAEQSKATEPQKAEPPKTEPIKKEKTTEAENSAKPVEKKEEPKKPVEVSEPQKVKTRPTEVKQQSVENTKSKESEKQPVKAAQTVKTQKKTGEAVKSDESKKNVEKKKTEPQKHTESQKPTKSHNIQTEQPTATSAQKKESVEKKTSTEIKAPSQKEKVQVKTSGFSFGLSLKNLFKFGKKSNLSNYAQNKIVINTKKPSVSSLEDEFRKMNVTKRDNVKAQFAAKEFLEDYSMMVYNNDIDADKLNSNNIQVLKKLDRDKGKDNKPLHEYLDHRIQNLRQIDRLQRNADSNFKRRQAKEPEIVKNKDGQITKIIVPDVTQPEMQHTQNGCWSVALSSLLRHKGVDVSQETIRSFRPDTNKDVSTVDDILAMNGDQPNSIGLFRELVFNTVPDTAVNEVRGEWLNAPRSAEEEKQNWKFQPWTRQQIQDQIPDVMDKLRTVIQRGLADNKGPVAIVVGGHYRTIYGIENKEDEHGNEVQMLRIHDPNHPERTEMSLWDLAAGSHRTFYDNGKIAGEGFQFEAQWLQDLTNEKGELALSQELKNKNVSYVDHKLQCDQVLNGNRGSKDRNNGEKLTIDIGNDLIMNTYLPGKVKNLAKNRVKASVKTEELRNQKKQNTEYQSKKKTLHKENKSQVKQTTELKRKQPVMKAK